MRLHVLREVVNLPPAVEQYLDKAEQIIEYQDGRKYVDNDLSRSYEITEAIMRASGEFVVVDDEFEILGRFGTLDRAERARAGAKIEMAVDVAIEADEDNASADAE